ncbi:MAG TPA: TauD/TfdA family dioxygenase [Blastocatellia bacterium]|nr:TauD/TfdA family dioxygenase [Blastocatellia bacterium]
MSRRRPGRCGPINWWRLDDTTRELLLSALSQSPSPYDDFEAYVAWIVKQVALLPDPLVAFLLNFRNHPRASGALHIANLPTDPVLPATPEGDVVRLKESFVSEGCLTLFGSVIGQVFSYRAEKNGAFFHNVKPTRVGLTTRSNAGSLVDFDDHVEAAFDPLSPNHLALYCLRADHECRALTTIGDARLACELLCPEQVEALRRPDFQIRAPESFRANLQAAEWSEPLAVLSGPADAVELRVNFNHMRALNSAGEQALQALHNALHAPEAMAEVALQPGAMLIINNRVCVHGRKPFVPRFDGRDRWLQRVYLRADLWPGRARANESLRVF